MIKRQARVWVLWLLLLLAVWWDSVFPLADGPLYRAEPFSLTAFFISLAISAASFGLQLLLRPKPPKVTRGQQTGELFIQNADEGSPVAEIYGASPGGATTQRASWENVTRATINASGNLQNDNSGTDNCFTNATGTGDSGGSVVATITGGDFEVAWTFRATASEVSGDSGRSFVGLKTGAFSLDFTLYKYCIHASTEINGARPRDTVYVFETSSSPSAFLDSVWNEGDTLRIRCVNGVVTYWHKSTLIFTSTVVPTYPLRVCASMACFNSTVEDLTVTTTPTDTNGGIKTAGTVIWCKEPRKVITTEKKGGKGAPKQTVETITYFTDLAILFARGRQRLKKLWANADLIIDLDAGIGLATGVLDAGATSTTTYSTTSPPPTSIGSSSPMPWSFRLAAPEATGTLSGSTGAGGAAMRFYEGNYDQLPDALIQSDVGAGNAPAYRGFAYLVIENFNISKYGGVPTFLATVENVDHQKLDTIANHLCERVGIEPGDRDFSPFVGQTVRGLMVQEPQAPRQTLELASIPYKAEFYETVDGTLTGKYFGGASVATISANELGMQEGDQVSVQGEMGDKLQFSLVVDDQLPRQINVTAFNPLNNHETVTQPAYRMTGFAQGVENLTLPMALTPDETRQTAERILYQRHVERESAAMRLPWKYSFVNPTDIITVVSAGITHKLRLSQVAGSVPGLLEMQLAADDTSVYSQTIDNCERSDVVWECATNFAVTGNDIVKNGGDDGFQVAFAQSDQVITHAGEFFEFKMPNVGPEITVGLSHLDCPSCVVLAGRCIFDRLFATGDVYFFFSLDTSTWFAGEADFDKTSGTYTTSTVFSYRRNGRGKIELLVDGVVVYTSAANAAPAMRINALAGSRSFPANQEPGVADAIFGACPAYPAPTIPAPATSIALLVDTVMLRDADDKAGYYVGVAPQTSDDWSGAALYRDRGAGYEKVETFLAPATAGVLAVGVTPTNVTTFDNTTNLFIDLYGTTASLASATELQVLNGANAAILGDGMVFQFKTATKTVGLPNRWTLSGLLWGRRGSDFALGTIAAGSRFLLLDGAVLFVENDLAERGIARNFKAVTNGYAIGDTAATSFTWQCRTLMPLSVVDVQGTRDGSNNLTITWKRRTRIGGHWADGQDVPLGELTEKYEVDVMSGSTVVRTISVTAQTANYLAADATADGLPPGGPVTFKLYQISNTVGRGFVRQAVL